jgi:hypothetical protein
MLAANQSTLTARIAEQRQSRLNAWMEYKEGSKYAPEDLNPFARERGIYERRRKQSKQRQTAMSDVIKENMPFSNAQVRARQSVDEHACTRRGMPGSAYCL